MMRKSTAELVESARNKTWWEGSELEVRASGRRDQKGSRAGKLCHLAVTSKVKFFCKPIGIRLKKAQESLQWFVKIVKVKVKLL